MIKRAHIYVLLQLGIIFLILVSGPIFSKSLFLLIIQILGICLTFWSVLVMKWGNLNISPEVKSDSELRQSGPYKWIRHPMYLSILIYISPLLIDSFDYGRLALFIALIITLNLKLNFEEELLTQKFTSYRDYQLKSWKLIPFIY